MESTKIKAKDAEIGKVYLSAVANYKVKVLNISTNIFNGKEVCLRVHVESESFPGTAIDISGETELLEFSEEQHIKPERNSSVQNKNKNKIITNQKKEVTMEEKEKKPSKLSIINAMLAEISGKGTKEQYAKIVDALIEKTGESPERTAQLMHYVKLVHYKQKRKASTETEATETEATETEATETEATETEATETGATETGATETEATETEAVV